MIDISYIEVIYGIGLYYSFIITCSAFFIFSCWRWSCAVNGYIKTGVLDDVEHSWFWTEKWLFASEYRLKHSNHLHYQNHPLIIAIDLIYAVFILFMASLAWPITFIVITVIAYAKIMRAQERKKQEFVKKLAGEHS